MRMANAALSQLLRRGKKCVCIGKNYDDHITELTHLVPGKVWDKTKEKNPVIFLKPTTSYAFPGEPLVLPRGLSPNEVHHEVELAVLIGEKAKDVVEENDDEVLRRYVAGYLVAVDMTARDVQTEAKKKGMPWAVSKGYDSFLPLSEPFDAAGVGQGWKNFKLWLDVNGTRRQTGEAGVMLHSVPNLIRYCSTVMTLEPGDLISTGTPAGVGPVRPGDVMTCGIEGKCRLEVKVEQQPPLNKL